MPKHEFEAQIIKSDIKGGLTYINIPFSALDGFNGKGKIKVQGTLNDYPYRSSLIPKGKGIYILAINKSMQKGIGLIDNDILQVTIEPDSAAEKSNLKTCFEKFDTSNMEVLTAIRTRRSIRKFSAESIDEKNLNTILEAGFCAPSAKNKRPWHFIIVEDKDTLSRLSENDANHKPINGAACCVVICGDKNIQGMNDFLLEDCSAAIQNILLASHGLGLGAVWCGVYKGTNTYKYIIDILQLPVKIVPVAIIALGYPAENKEEVERFDVSKLHYERW